MSPARVSTGSKLAGEKLIPPKLIQLLILAQGRKKISKKTFVTKDH